MRQRIIATSVFLLGTILLSGLSNGMLVQSSETTVSITPETPKEEKSYYVENQKKLFQEKEQENLYKIRYYTLQIQKDEFQEMYLQALAEELEEKLKIENSKLETGYSTQISVNEIETQLNATKLQMETVQAQQVQYKENIQIYGGTYKQLQVEEEVLALSGDYIREFQKDNLQIKYYEEQLENYQEYIEENEEAEDLEDIKIQRNLAEIDKQQYEANLQVYVEEKVLQYETVLRNIEQVNNEIKLVEEKIKTNRQLYESGKITQIQITELETEQKRLLYEKMSLIYDADCIRYILEEKIEGVEI